ncbi:MAG: bifunctional demethylmenaquinone methyltransferase/2-methoxy-6-polyprenyl-1,4-benzoquinol methylase UbiE [Sphingomonadales bacterium]
MRQPLPHDTITPLHDSTRPKKQQVADMFDRIAKRYDLMNRFLSARIDLYWRKKAIAQLKQSAPKKLLDVATGTADLSLLAYRMLKPDQIIGIDISEGMLQIGREKIRQRQLDEQIRLLYGDAETINAPDRSFDAVMVAFGVRNFENLQAGLSEMLRVLKPGGQLVVVEFATPRNGFFRRLYNGYMKDWAPRLAQQLNTDGQAYAYLNRSSNAFPDREAFVALLQEAGYSKASFTPLTFGICCLYTATRPY